MENSTQINRLKAVRAFVEANFKDKISPAQISDIACYSYRNINRIFKAVYRESIGSCIKRLQIEASAKEILYTEKSITDIAYEAGYSDLQAFNKSFKSIYGSSPLQFRKKKNDEMQLWKQINEVNMKENTGNINYRLETLPDLKVLYLPYHGSYDIQAIDDCWLLLLEYAEKHKLLGDETLFLGEVIDDEDIAQPDRCRYNCAITLTGSVDIQPSGFLDIKNIEKQNYAIFTHRGSYESMEDTYDLIYGQWLIKEAFEPMDKPVLELYVKGGFGATGEAPLTEICIPVK